MKLIIAGSRSANYINIQLPICEICAIMNIDVEKLTEVVSGGATGIDTMGENFASFFDIPTKRFLPDYEGSANKKTAPLERNTLMAEYGDVLLLIWDGSSRGSLDMKKKMEAQGKPVHVYTFDANCCDYDLQQKLTHQALIDTKMLSQDKDLNLLVPTQLEIDTLKKGLKTPVVASPKKSGRKIDPSKKPKKKSKEELDQEALDTQAVFNNVNLKA